MKSNHIVVIYFVFVIAGLVLSNMMESLKEMTELGQALGYEGDELKAFVRGSKSKSVKNASPEERQINLR